jgi:hypothetical protein
LRSLVALAFVTVCGCLPYPAGAGDVPDLSAADLPPPPLDECTDAPAGRACITLHLLGDVAAIDTLQVDAKFELAGTDVDRRTTSHHSGGAVTPPIALGVVLTANAGPSVSLTVLASANGAPVALGTVSVTHLAPGQHDSEAVGLVAAAQSRCFDHVKDGSERDVDCGGPDCPACTIGQQCLGSDDCANAVCTDDLDLGFEYRCH